MIINTYAEDCHRIEYCDEIKLLVIEMTQQCISDYPDIWKEKAPELYNRFNLLSQKRDLHRLLYPTNN